MSNHNFNEILEKGITIQSSGTTGTPKKLFQSPEKIKIASKVALYAQEINSSSKVYTVCKLDHAGGLLAQTIPAYTVGAYIVIDSFNPYTFMRRISGFTHTHLTPAHAKAVMQTKSFASADLSGLWVTCGSDMVSYDIIRAFVERGATFMVNWGMSEVGPIAINTTFNSVDMVDEYESRAIDGCTLMGDTFYCNSVIIGKELCVSGDICIYNDLFETGDHVIMNDKGEYYYKGRL